MPHVRALPPLSATDCIAGLDQIGSDGGRLLADSRIDQLGSMERSALIALLRLSSMRVKSWLHAIHTMFTDGMGNTRWFLNTSSWPSPLTSSALRILLAECLPSTGSSTLSFGKVSIHRMLGPNRRRARLLLYSRILQLPILQALQCHNRLHPMFVTPLMWLRRS